MNRWPIGTLPLAIMLLSGLGVCAAVLASMQPEESQDWPQWRGANGTGIVEGASLPTTWGGGENIAWKTELRGLGVSSPIVFGDRVFITYQLGRGKRSVGVHPMLTRGPGTEVSLERPLGDGTDGTDDKRLAFVVAALDRADGRMLWEYEIDAAGELYPVHDKHNLASPSPVTDGVRVYAWFGTGQVVALNMRGQLVWQRHLGEENSPFKISWGHASSPTLHEGTIILQCDHGQAAYLLWLDVRTGNDILRVDRNRTVTSHSTPVIVSGPRGDELIVNSSERLESYDPRTGELLWYTGVPNRFPIGVATHEAGILYASRGYRSGPYMAIRLGGRGDVTNSHVIWRVAAGAPYVSSLIHYRRRIYMANGNGIVTAVNASSGDRVWQERVGGIYSASPVAGDGKVYFLSEAGEAVVIKAGDKPRVLARNQLHERTIASPAISRGQIFIRTDRHLVAIGK